MVRVAAYLSDLYRILVKVCSILNFAYVDSGLLHRVDRAIMGSEQFWK